MCSTKIQTELGANVNRRQEINLYFPSFSFHDFELYNICFTVGAGAVAVDLVLFSKFLLFSILVCIYFILHMHIEFCYNVFFLSLSLSSELLFIE